MEHGAKEVFKLRTCQTRHLKGPINQLCTVEPHTAFQNKIFSKFQSSFQNGLKRIILLNFLCTGKQHYVLYRITQISNKFCFFADCRKPRQISGQLFFLIALEQLGNIIARLFVLFQFVLSQNFKSLRVRKVNFIKRFARDSNL